MAWWDRIRSVSVGSNNRPALMSSLKIAYISERSTESYGRELAVQYDHDDRLFIRREGVKSADVVEKVLVAGDPWDNSCELSLTRIYVYDGATATGPEHVVL